MSDDITVDFAKIKPDLLDLSALVNFFELVMTEADLGLTHLCTYHVLLWALRTDHTGTRCLLAVNVIAFVLYNIVSPFHSFACLLFIFVIVFLVFRVPNVALALTRASTRLLC